MFTIHKGPAPKVKALAKKTGKLTPLVEAIRRMKPGEWGVVHIGEAGTREFNQHRKNAGRAVALAKVPGAFAYTAEGAKHGEDCVVVKIADDGLEHATPLGKPAAGGRSRAEKAVKPSNADDGEIAIQMLRGASEDPDMEMEDLL